MEESNITESNIDDFRGARCQIVSFETVSGITISTNGTNKAMSGSSYSENRISDGLES